MKKNTILGLMLLAISVYGLHIEVVDSFVCPASISSGNQDLAYSKQGIIWIANDHTDNIYGVNVRTHTIVRTFASPYTDPGPQGLTIDDNSGKLWIAEHHHGGAGERIFSLSLATGALIDEFPCPLTWPEGLTLVGDTMYIIGGGTTPPTIYGFDLSDSTHPYVHSYSVPVVGNGVTWNGDKFVWGTLYTLYTYDPDSGIVESCSTPMDFDGISYAYANYYWVSCFSGNKVYKIQLVDTTSSVKENLTTAIKLNMGLLPNPTNGAFSIVGLGNREFVLKMYDVVGKLIITKKENTAMPIELPNSLASGIYFCRVQISGATYDARLVVIK